MQKLIKYKPSGYVWIILGLCIAQALLATGLAAQKSEAQLTLDEILKRIEQRYQGAGFSARFKQTSIIKAIDISDTAQGRIFVRRPDQMRWEYEVPEKQTIITDGQRLLISRPELNQVMQGNAPDYLADGKGASFLSDIRQLQERFSVIMDKSGPEPYYILNLLPINPIPDVSYIVLHVSKKGFEVLGFITKNLFGDETKIEFSNFKFNLELSNDLFEFKVPQGADVIQMGE